MPEIFNWDLIDLSQCKLSGENNVTCPICAKDRKKKNTKSLRVNMTKGVAHCLHCAASAYDKSKESQRVDEYVKKEYKVPALENMTALSDAALSWFEKERHLLQKVLIDWNIQVSEQYFPQSQARHRAIAFPYMRDGKVVNVKYRTKDKQFMLTKDAELILYGLDTLKGCETAYICEGEIDALSLSQCGFKEVVSVPNGVAISEKEKERYKETGEFDTDRPINLEYIDNCYEQIKHVQKWFLCTDGDLPGMKLRFELLRRFGAENCFLVDFGDCKDANEAMVKHGIQYVKDCVANAKECEIPGVVSNDELTEYLDYVYTHGIDKGLEIGIPTWDKHYRQRLGELDIFTGIASHGKSWFTLWLNVLNSCLFGWKWVLFMPENYPAGKIRRSLIEILTGKKFDKKHRRRILEAEWKLANDWVDKHFYIVDFGEEMATMDNILKVFKTVVKQKGVHGCVVDPLNDLSHVRRPGQNLDEYYQEMLTKIRLFKRKYNLKFILTAHPHTSASREKETHVEQGTRSKVVELSDITGGNIFHNRADNGLSIYRNVKDENYFYTTEVHVEKVKFQEEVGKPTTKENPIRLQYDVETSRFRIDKVDPLENWFRDKLWKPATTPEQLDAFDKTNKEMEFPPPTPDPDEEEGARRFMAKSNPEIINPLTDEPETEAPF